LVKIWEMINQVEKSIKKKIKTVTDIFLETILNKCNRSKERAQ